MSSRSRRLLLAICLFLLSSAATADGEVSLDEFTTALRKNFDRFPLVTPGTDANGSARFVALTLFRQPVLIGNTVYDGFRFVAPPGAKQLSWAFVTSTGYAQWYILPRSGAMTGFETYHTEDVSHFPRLHNAAYDGSLTLQSLPDGALTPGREYLIWFAETAGGPLCSVAAALTFRASGESSAQIVGILRLNASSGVPSPPLLPTSPAPGAVPQQLSSADLAGLNVGSRTLVGVEHLRKTGQIQTRVIMTDNTRFALSQVTFNLILYGAGLHGHYVASSFPYTVSIGPAAAGAPNDIAPLEQRWVQSGPLNAHLKRGRNINGGYWIDVVSAEGRAFRPAPALPPQTRLRMAALMGDLATLQEVTRAAPQLVRDGEDGLGTPLLDDTAMGNHGAAASYLLDQGASVDGPDPGYTPLMCAADWGSAQVVDVLLAHHADTALKDYHGRTALDHARALLTQPGAGPGAQQVVRALTQAQAGFLGH